MTEPRSVTLSSMSTEVKLDAELQSAVERARSDQDQGELRSRIASLPDTIGLIGPRTLVPVMAGLRTPRQLDFLSAEALALAVITESAIAVRTDSPPLREACEALHVGYRTVGARLPDAWPAGRLRALAEGCPRVTGRAVCRRRATARLLRATPARWRSGRRVYGRQRDRHGGTRCRRRRRGGWRWARSLR